MDSVEQTFRDALKRHRDGDLAGAVDGYRRALALAPDNTRIRNNLSLALLALGRIDEGFDLYDVRFERDELPVRKPPLSFPEWRGEDLTGRSLLVWPEQGFGDLILFARFLPLLVERGASVTMFAPPPLVRLLRHLPAVILPADGPVSIPKCDVWVMSGSLPGRLGLTADDLPSAPYLPSASGGAGVGLFAQGRPFPPGRSLPDPARDGLLALPGVRSLAPEDTGAADFEDTRAMIAGLELVISVDSAVAALAGAMGKPTLVLLSYTADWRWGLGERSPWFPTARLVRQPAPGDWGPVVDAAERAVKATARI